MWHPTDTRSICERCGEKFLVVDGCECYDLTDEELKEQKEAKGEYLIDIFLLNKGN